MMIVAFPPKHFAMGARLWRGQEPLSLKGHQVKKEFANYFQRKWGRKRIRIVFVVVIIIMLMLHQAR
jgi:hypothetical protein